MINLNIDISLYNDISISDTFYDEPNCMLNIDKDLLLIGHSKPMISVYCIKSGKKKGRTGTPGKPSIFSTMKCNKKTKKEDD